MWRQSPLNLTQNYRNGPLENNRETDVHIKYALRIAGAENLAKERRIQQHPRELQVQTPDVKSLFAQYYLK